MSTILVTGAAGNVGQEVVRALLAKRATVVAADHKTDRVSALFGGNVIATRLDFNDRATWAPAFHGAEHMFLMRPPAIADVENNLNPFVDFARSKGLERLLGRPGRSVQQYIADHAALWEETLSTTREGARR